LFELKKRFPLSKVSPCSIVVEESEYVFYVCVKISKVEQYVPKNDKDGEGLVVLRSVNRVSDCVEAVED